MNYNPLCDWFLKVFSKGGGLEEGMKEGRIFLAITINCLDCLYGRSLNVKIKTTVSESVNDKVTYYKPFLRVNPA